MISKRVIGKIDTVATRHYWLVRSFFGYRAMWITYPFYSIFFSKVFATNSPWKYRVIIFFSMVFSRLQIEKKKYYPLNFNEVLEGNIFGARSKKLEFCAEPR